MSKTKFKYNLTEIEKEILEFIADHPFCTRSDIASKVFNGDERKKSSVYKYIGKFKKLRFVNSKLLDEAQGARSTQCIYILSHGSWAISRKHKSVSPSRLSIESHKKQSVKNSLLKICEARSYHLYTENQDCRKAIAVYLAIIDKVSGRPIQANEYYLSCAPKKIPPDMVLTTSKELILVIVSDIQDGVMAFSQRFIRYKDILPFVGCIVICMNEYQKQEWVRILQNRQPKFLNFEIVQSIKRIKIFTYDEVDKIETYLQNL